ncbi:MAG TPA: transglutaminase-like domain-containing protein [Prolixibacteraceae bacterium]|nr:transglutaminase-like domain-containing protein [Prolixibacteraceae bacterium]
MDDPEPLIFEAVEKELLKENSSVIPALETVWETTPHEICQIRIEYLIQRILFRENYNKLRQWSRQPSPDLLEGFILASRYHYPDLNEPEVRRHIEEIRKKVWVEINNSLTSIEKITVLNHVFFHDFRLKVAGDENMSPQHCFINRVLETGTGNAVSLALLYTIVAQKLELPVRYVDLPRHPLLAYVDRRIAARVHPPGIETDVLFYINPANNGSITGRKELEYMLKKLDYDLTHACLEASSPKVFLLRLLEITERSYEMSGQTERTADILRMMSIFSGKK